jgi:hypothetical protein
LNGKIADHERRLSEMQIELAALLEDRVRPVEDYIKAEKASAKTSSVWVKWLWPVIWAAAGAFVLLLALHSTDLLKFKL